MSSIAIQGLGNQAKSVLGMGAAPCSAFRSDYRRMKEIWSEKVSWQRDAHGECRADRAYNGLMWAATTHVREGNWSDRDQLVLEAAQAEYTILIRLTLGRRTKTAPAGSPPATNTQETNPLETGDAQGRSAPPTLVGCLCWSETNARLNEKGYKLADVCSMLTVTDGLGLHATRGVPLEKADGARLKRDDPRMLQVSYCCFCGKKYPNGKAS